MAYYTYVIESTSSGLLYIGQTNNPEDRLARHNQHRNRWTKFKGPWKQIFLCAFNTRSEAMALERKLKSFKDPEYLRTWIEAQPESTTE
jgi:putative endonuclease